MDIKSSGVTADALLQCWRSGEAMAVPLNGDKPALPEDGYAIQAELTRLLSGRIAGWKIAATAEAGRRHIHVDSPLAGRLVESMVAEDGASVSLSGNRMRVAEAEIVLTLNSDLAPLERPRTELEVVNAVGTMHAGLELPDSRFDRFTEAGAACLIADNACARDFVLGNPVAPPPDLRTLADMKTALRINNQVVSTGYGRDAMGGSLIALTWLINTVNALGVTVRAGEFVTTGVTGAPVAVQPDDKLEVVIGKNIASVSATLRD
ncbi:MAG: 2-keto-4-pentenoate hydratase [Granulosicoccus sp.]